MSDDRATGREEVEQTMNTPNTDNHRTNNRRDQV